MSSLLNQPGRSIHRVSRTAPDLHITQRRVRGDGARRDNIGTDACGGCETGREDGTSDRAGGGSEGRSEGDEGCECPVDICVSDWGDLWSAIEDSPGGLGERFGENWPCETGEGLNECGHCDCVRRGGSAIDDGCAIADLMMLELEVEILG